MQKDSDSEKTTDDIRELRMLFFRSTERLFLSTAASGTDMKAADMQQHPKQELSSGRKSLTGCNHIMGM